MVWWYDRLCSRPYSWWYSVSNVIYCQLVRLSIALSKLLHTFLQDSRSTMTNTLKKSRYLVWYIVAWSTITVLLMSWTHPSSKRKIYRNHCQNGTQGSEGNSSSCRGRRDDEGEGDQHKSVKYMIIGKKRTLLPIPNKDANNSTRSYASLWVVYASHVTLEFMMWRI